MEVSLIKTTGMSYKKFSWALLLLAEGPLMAEGKSPGNAVKIIPPQFNGE
jgi:hypothetical protein